MIEDIVTIDQNDELVYELPVGTLGNPNDITFDTHGCYELILSKETISIFVNI